jgi:ubiquinone/menaquinone biosynthesis C-methylase UbiE
LVEPASSALYLDNERGLPDSTFPNKFFRDCSVTQSPVLPGCCQKSDAAVLPLGLSIGKGQIVSQSEVVLEQQRAIREEYRKQAPSWGTYDIDEDLRWVVEQLPLSPSQSVLDVAAGSGLFGRALAHRVASVTAVDITPEMIDEGRRRAKADGIDNLRFELGSAEALPFADESFDLVMSRYAIHHFADPQTVLREMSRVCKGGGLVVNVDMVACENPAVRTYQNDVERMMDATHTMMLSPSQLVQTTTEAGLTMVTYLSRDVRVKFDEWQPHVSPDSDAYRSSRQALEAELSGGNVTGMQPFVDGGELYFIHVWGVMIAGKPATR